MRKLATIRKIDNLLPIEGADLIMAAVIDGWTVVVKKSEFEVGELCVYCEIDSFLPDGNPAWQHLVEKHPRMFEGQRGHRLKTVRLRGQVSQGFLAPLSVLGPPENIFTIGEGCIGADVSEQLGIKKFELPVPAELAGQVGGNFPGFIPKTDQERCQNIGNDIFVANAESKYEVTMKMDGSSFTGFAMEGAPGVCGRNWELKINDDNASNSLVRMYVDSGLQAALLAFGKNLAVQGELMGHGIQGNREELKAHKLFVFDMYDIDAKAYLTPEERHATLTELWNLGLSRDMVEHSPVLYMGVTMGELGITSVQGLLKFAEGASYHHPVREGLVFKRVDGGFSFKAISNSYLLKEKD